MSKRRNNNASQTNPSPKGGAGRESIGVPQATIIAAIISTIGVIATALLAYWGIQTQVYGPMHATQTAHAQTVSYANPLPSATPLPASGILDTPILPGTEAPNPSPEFTINVLQPTHDSLKVVPAIIVGYHDITTPGTNTYKAKVSSRRSYLWTFNWCAKKTPTLNDNLSAITFSYYVNNVQVPEDLFLTVREIDSEGWSCQKWATLLSGFDVSRPTTLSVVYYVPAPLSDGALVYPIGEYRHEITLSFVE